MSPVHLSLTFWHYEWSWYANRDVQLPPLGTLLNDLRILSHTVLINSAVPRNLEVSKVLLFDTLSIEAWAILHIFGSWPSLTLLALSISSFVCWHENDKDNGEISPCHFKWAMSSCLITWAISCSCQHPLLHPGLCSWLQADFGLFIINQELQELRTSGANLHQSWANVVL